MNACGKAAFTDYNNKNLELSQSAGAFPLKTVETILAQRRLQEDFCLKFARCVVGDPAEQSLDIPFRAEFGSCLDDEAKETVGDH
jgi:hypothetical protein